MKRMKEVGWVCLLALAVTAILVPGWADAQEKESYELPDFKDMTAFRSAYERHAGDPGYVAALFVQAMYALTLDKPEGLRRITLLLAENQLSAGDVLDGNKPGPGMAGHVRRLLDKPYIARNYFADTSPAGGYRIPDTGPVVSIKKDPRGNPDPDRIKLFVRCTGADSPRPVTLKKGRDGRFRVAEASSLFVGVRPPEK